MRRNAPAALLAAFALAAWSAALAADPSPAADKPTGARAFAGRTYEGVVTARVQPPKDSGLRAKNHHGGGTAELQLTGKDTARLLLVGNVQQDNDASFAADGEFVGADWRGASSVPVTISADGKISGSGETGGSHIEIDGQFVDRKLDVFVELRPAAPTPGGFPVGTAFQFRYQLVHAVPYAERPAGDGKQRDGCREVVYRTKLVPNLFGGTMSTVRVPECRR